MERESRPNNDLGGEARPGGGSVCADRVYDSTGDAHLIVADPNECEMNMPNYMILKYRRFKVAEICGVISDCNRRREFNARAEILVVG